MNAITHVQFCRRIRNVMMATFPLLCAGIFMARSDMVIGR